jgi:multicomponent Na+:H+ antiporter subunit C
VNLLIFTSGGYKRGAVPFIKGDSIDPAAITDPLPQALILTAIVIGFAVVAFVIALLQVFYASRKTDDVDDFTREEVA